jgi:hypothetical protein
VTVKLKDAATDRLAWEIADFTPIAFSRAILAEMKVRLHDHYVRIDSQGRLRTYRKLADEPVYVAAESLVMEFARRDGDVLIKVARHCPGFQMVNAALHAGSKAADLEASPPILNGPDELCDPLDAAPPFAERPWWMDTWKPKKPWWKFW